MNVEFEKKIYHALDNYNKTEIFSFFTNNNSRSQMRMKNFAKANIQYRKGNYKNALFYLNDASLKYGDHISLKMLRAWSHYYSGHCIEAEMLFKEAKNEFSKIKFQLSRDSFVKTQLSFAQYFELEGLVYESLRVYDELLLELKKTEESHYYYLILSQSLRLRSEFNDIRVSEKETYLAFLGLADMHPNIYISHDIQHALATYEFINLSEEIALKRLKSITEESHYSWDNVKIVFFDILELSMLKYEYSSKNFLNKLENILSIRREYKFNAYELFLLKLNGMLGFQKTCFTENEFIGEILSIRSNISKANMIKLFALCKKIFSFKTTKINNFESLIFQEIDPFSLPYWSLKYPDTFNFNLIKMGNNIKILEFDFKLKEIFFNQNALELPKGALILKLIEAIAGKTTISTSEAYYLLWGQVSEVAYFNRLRNLISRINKSIKIQTGLEKAIKLTKNSIVLNSNLLIYRR